MLVEDFLTFTVFQVVVGIHLIFIPLLAFIYYTLRKLRYRFFEALQHLLTPLQFVLKHAADNFIFFHHFHAIIIHFVVEKGKVIPWHLNFFAVIVKLLLVLTYKWERGL